MAGGQSGFVSQAPDLRSTPYPLDLPGHSRILLQMFRKTLSRTYPHGRTFHSSTTVRRVVATTPVKAEEVKVGQLNYIFVSGG
jgi:hypothetical protein